MDSLRCNIPVSFASGCQSYGDLVLQREVNSSYPYNLHFIMNALSPEDWKSEWFSEYSDTEVMENVSFILRGGVPIGILNCWLQAHNDKEYELHVDLVYLLASERGQGYMKDVCQYISDNTKSAIQDKLDGMKHDHIPLPDSIKLSVEMTCISIAGARFKNALLNNMANEFSKEGDVHIEIIDACHVKEDVCLVFPEAKQTSPSFVFDEF